MQIDDEAIILKKKKYGESSLLITFFSNHNGINTGLVKGVLKKDFGTYEIGNKVQIKCNFRIENQLWNCKFELIKNYSVIFFDNINKLNTLLCICTLLDISLPRKLPQINLYKRTVKIIESLVLKSWLKKYIFWELFFLSEIGYGLSLKKCAISGSTKNLKYISPKSGHAISELEGDKFKNKLIKMPNLFINNLDNQSTANAFKVTGFFLEKYLKENHNRTLPFYREKILN